MNTGALECLQKVGGGGLSEKVRRIPLFGCRTCFPHNFSFWYITDRPNSMHRQQINITVYLQAKLKKKRDWSVWIWLAFPNEVKLRRSPRLERFTWDQQGCISSQYFGNPWRSEPRACTCSYWGRRNDSIWQSFVHQIWIWFYLSHRVKPATD